MSTITKERLQRLIRAIDSGSYDEEEIVGWVNSDEIMELAQFPALASLEAEPVAWRYRTTDINGNHNPNWSFSEEASLLGLYQPLYTAPPAPVSVPDRSMFEKWWESEHGSPLDSWDSLRTTDGYCDDGIDGQFEAWNACRAAILHGAVQPQNQQQNIPKNVPATQFKTVADLYGLTSPTGSETSFTFDAVEARGFIDGGWSVQEYVELERYQEAASGNSPVIPDGYVLVPVEPTEHMIVEGFESEPAELFSDEEVWGAYDAMSGCQQAAPKLE